MRALYADMAGNTEVIFKPYMQNDTLMEQIADIGDLLGKRKS